MRAIIDGSSDELISQPNIRMAMMFDHEEVGSSSCAGAGSSMFMDTLRLINDSLTDKSHGNGIITLKFMVDYLYHLSSCC